MPDNLYAPANQAEMEATFPARTIRVAGEPTLLGLLDIYRHILNCVAAFVSSYHPLNLLYIAVPEDLWSMYSTDPHPNAPANPGEKPVLNANGTTGANAIIRDNWANLRKHYLEYLHMNRALIDRMLSCMDADITTNYKQTNLMSNPKSKYLDVFQHFFDVYGIVTPALEEQNKENMKKK